MLKIQRLIYSTELSVWYLVITDGEKSETVVIKQFWAESLIETFPNTHHKSDTGSLHYIFKSPNQ